MYVCYVCFVRMSATLRYVRVVCFGLCLYMFGVCTLYVCYVCNCILCVYVCMVCMYVCKPVM